MKTSIQVSFFALLLFAAGCGGGANDLKLVPVAGVVKYSNAPVSDAALVFYPEKGPPGVAKTDQNGAFRVQTNGRSGGTIGKNKITVSISQSAAIPPSDGRAMDFKNDTSYFKKYSNDQETPLIIEVPAAGSKELKLDLVD